MQSFLQYRRYGHRVKQQLERNQIKQESLKAANESDHPSVAQTEAQRAVQGDEDVDLEKAEAPAQSSDASPDSEEREPIEEEDHASPPNASNASDDGFQKPVALSRASTQSVRTLGTRLGHALSGINVRDRTTREGGDRSRQVFVVDFESEDDPMNPQNWSKVRRVCATFLVAYIGAVVGIASSIDSSVLMPASKEFGVSEVAESLATGELISFPQYTFN